MTFRQLYFELSKEENKYLTGFVIKEFLVFVGDFSSFSELFLNFDNEISKDISKEISLLKQGYPIQYLTNQSYFLGECFFVDESTLIPRQETEQLVIETSELIKTIFPNKKLNILDMCAGSGVIGLSIKKKHDNSNMTLSDISKDAINVCKINSKKLNLPVNLVVGDMFENISGKYDVLISNPPYIGSKKSIDEQVWKYEPHNALLADPKTKFYEIIFKNINKYMNKQYLLAFEIGEDMKEELDALCKKYFTNEKIIFTNDIYGKLRFLYIIKN